MNKEAYENIIRVLLAHIDALEENVQMVREARNERDEVLKRLSEQNKAMDVLKHKVYVLESDLTATERTLNALRKATFPAEKRKVGRPKGSKNKSKAAA